MLRVTNNDALTFLQRRDSGMACMKMLRVTSNDALTFLQRRDSGMACMILKERREVSASTRLVEMGGSRFALRRMPWMVKAL